MNAKKPALLCLFLVSCSFCFAQDRDSTRRHFVTKKGRPVYVSLYGQMGIPMKDFKNYSRVQGGFGLEAALGFVDNNKSFSLGATLMMLATGVKKDTYHGLKVETSTALVQIGPMMRWAPVVPWRVVPFISASGGVGISSTGTSSQIVDKATFLEQFFNVQEEDITTTTSHKESTGASASYCLSAGILIKPAFILSFSYFSISKVKYVDQGTVSVVDGEVVYQSNVIPVQMFNISLGVSNWAHGRNFQK